MTQQALAKKEPNEIQEGKRPLVMKSGLIHWLTEDTAANLENSLAEQQAHGFIKITELGITINTADIGDGILTMVQYQALLKKKQGEWQCEEGTWHTKNQRECTCRADRMKSKRRALDQRKRDEENRPQTPEERKRSQETVKRTGEELVLQGVLPHAGREIRRSTLEDWKEAGKPMAVSEEALKINEDIL